MKRREFLLTTGTAISISGCMDHEAVETLHPQSNTGSGKTYADIETERLITGESLIGAVPWAHVAISNETEFDHGKLDMAINFYDEDKSLRQQHTNSIEIFPTATTWTVFDPVTTPDKEEIVSIEANIEQAETGTSLTSPDTIQIEQSELKTTAGAGVTLTGTLYTGNYTGRIRLIGLVYDSKSRFRGTVVTTSDVLDLQDRWEFQASNPSIRTPAAQPSPASYDIRIDRISE
jgi:hypothetical protein